jgi:hypothetical protein
MRKILLFLLLPSLLWAGSFQLSTEQNVTPFVDGVEIDSLRTATSNSYSLPSGQVAVVISSGAVNYTDTFGVAKNYDFAIHDTTAGIYTHYIRPTDKWAFAFNEDGNFRWVHRRGALRVDPTFNRDSIDISFQFTRQGMKATYLLRKTAPTTLVWNWNFIPNAGQWQPTLQQIRDWVLARMPAPVAWDANGDTVDVVRTYNSTSMTFTIDAEGAVWPITVDPSAQDTTTLGGVTINTYAQASWTLARDPLTASFYDGEPTVGSSVVAGGGNGVWRGYLRFSMADLPVATAVDSVRLYLYQSTTLPYDGRTVTIFPVQGTFTGDTTGAWFNDFTGWTAGEPHTPTFYGDSVLFIASGDDSWSSTKFDSTGNAAIKNAMGVDSVSVVLISRDDIDNTAPVYDNRVRLSANTLPYLAVFYDEAPALSGWPHKGVGITPSKTVGIVPSKFLGL